MAVMIQPWLFFSLLFVFLNVITICNGQPNSPQNIETFFPSSDSQTPSQLPGQQAPSLLPPQVSKPQLPSSSANGSSSNTSSKVAKAVAVTAAITLVLSGLAFLLARRLIVARRKKAENNNGSPRDKRVVRLVPQAYEFERFNGNIKGLIVDENGLDVVYWKKLGSRNTQGFNTILSDSRNKESQTRKPDVIQEVPLLDGQSSSSQEFASEQEKSVDRTAMINHLPPPPGSAARYLKDVEMESTTSVSSTSPPAPSSPPTPPAQNIPPLAFPAIPKQKSHIPSTPPSPAPDKKSLSPPPPPPPPPPSTPKNEPVPPTPPITAKKGSAPPPPPPKRSSLNSSAKPPAVPTDTRSNSEQGRPSGDSSVEGGSGQVKLKPLHWDKVNANTDHSMVWDKLNGGSFRFDGDLMEVLFGYVATGKRAPQGSNTNSSNSDAVQAAKTFILDPRKSQNTAIVLKSLTISREEIIDSLKEGEGLSPEIIEKLARIAPTEEEQSLILNYNGDPAKLADAEAFLHHILKAVPSAFKCLNGILFRLNFDSEILHLKESLQTLELACKELRARGLFMKLLEAILKAGNRMNAGTSRGNAQAFNLSALRKLSDVKSIDGKTTLLHFVVEEVVRSEGKRCINNRNHSLPGKNPLNDECLASEEETDREYFMLGLPIVGGISADYSDVQKAAAIDYDSFIGTVSTLTVHMAEIWDILTECDNRGEGRFLIDMKTFLENAEQQLKVVKEEQTKVMELMKSTTEYYQTGSSKNRKAHPLELFVIIKDFLGMVDQACIEIARNIQKRKTSTASSSSPQAATPRAIKFPNLRGRFSLDKSGSSSSDSE